MLKAVSSDSKNNRRQFNTELKLYINQQLYNKHIISEEMYISAKEKLLKEAV